MKTLSASEFKARCLALLDEVSRTGEVIVVTKRGKEVARLVAPVRSVHAHPQDELRGTVAFHGDVVGPAVRPEDWGAVAEDAPPPEPEA